MLPKNKERDFQMTDITIISGADILTHMKMSSVQWQRPFN